MDKTVAIAWRWGRFLAWLLVVAHPLFHWFEGGGMESVVNAALAYLQATHGENV